MNNHNSVVMERARSATKSIGENKFTVSGWMLSAGFMGVIGFNQFDLKRTIDEVATTAKNVVQIAAVVDNIYEKLENVSMTESRLYFIENENEKIREQLDDLKNRITVLEARSYK